MEENEKRKIVPEVGHVLNDTDDRQFHLSAERDLLLHVQQTDLLWSGD